jgi:predicted DNA-binding transcriptional regulator AlpA
MKPHRLATAYSADARQAPPFESAEKPRDPDALMSVKEASEFLRMSDKWLYQSHIPFVRMGRRRLYFRSSLIEHALQRRSDRHLDEKKRQLAICVVAAISSEFPPARDTGSNGPPDRRTRALHEQLPE